MATPRTAPPAIALYDILNHKNGAPSTTDAMADNAMSDFLAEVIRLDKRHNKKPISQDHLVAQLFGHSGVFKNEMSYIPYFRIHLRAAAEQLGKLDGEMRSRNNGAITLTELVRFSDTLIDYVFDLNEVVRFLQRNVDGYVFINGFKTSQVTSWEVFLLAKGLAYQSSQTGPARQFCHKTAQIASIFVLRQAMELRFERLIAVYPINDKGLPPRLRHGFHQDFIVAHPQFFVADGFEIEKLRHLYDWCSGIVHLAYQPYAWQIAIALQRGGELLHTRSAPTNKAWSIYNAVEIPDVSAMQTAYEDHFLATYGHGSWRMTRMKPEALVRNWTANMAFTGDEYRPVVSPSRECRGMP